VNAVIDAAPANLNTLNELAEALGDDANYAATVTSSLATKADTTYVDSQIAAINVNNISGNLDVTGSIQLGDDARTASTAGAGTLRWNSGKLQNSDGSDWKDVVFEADGSTAAKAANSPAELKTVLGNPISDNYYINIPNHGVEQVYIDFTLDDARGFVIWVGRHFTGGQERWPGSTWEYMFGGSGNGGYSISTFTGSDGWRTNARLDPTWLSNMGVNGTGLVAESANNGDPLGGIASSSCYSWISRDTSASDFHNMFNDTPSVYQWTGMSINGNTNSPNRVLRATDVRWHGAHGNSDGVHQMASGTNTNSNGFMEFLANWGGDPNHSWTVVGTGGMSYHNAGSGISYPCSYSDRWAIFGWHW